MKPGIHTLAFEDYQKASGISNTMLKWLSAPYTPAHFKARWIDGTIVEEETPALRVGQLTHRVILEPDTLEGAFWVKPDGMNFTTKDGKAWRDEHQDRPIITADDATAVKAMREAVHAHPVARRLIAHSQKEKNLFAEDAKGTLRKARLDLLPDSGNALPDLKTCLSAHPDEFAKAIFNNGYFRQAAFYLALTKLLGMEFSTWLFIAVEKTPPYAVNVVQLDQLAIEYGATLINADLQIYRNCVESGEWPAYGGGVNHVSLPPWAMREAEKLAA
jgi:hypothetical protein